MSQILISDPFLFPPSGEEFSSADILPENYSSSPPDNFFEFTRTQFEQEWQAESELFVNSNSFDLFSPEEDDSDSGISYSTFGSPEAGLEKMDQLMEFSGTLMDSEMVNNFENGLLDPMFSSSSAVEDDEVEDLLSDGDISDEFICDIIGEDLNGEEKPGKHHDSYVSSSTTFELSSVGLLNDIFEGLVTNGEINEQNKVKFELIGQPVEDNIDFHVGQEVKRNLDGSTSDQVLVQNVAIVQGVGGIRGGSGLGCRSRRKSNHGVASFHEEEVIIFEEEVSQTQLGNNTLQRKRCVKKGRIEKPQREKKPIIKMHMLDPNEHPKARNAVAARLRRERDHQKKLESNNLLRETQTRLDMALSRISKLEEELKFYRTPHSSFQEMIWRE